MKLAEALAQRSDLNKRLEQLKARILRVAKVQEGDPPAEDPATLVAEYETCATELTDLVTRINLTNAQTQLDGRLLTAALAERETLGLRQQMFRDLAKAAVVTQTVNTRSEIRFKSSVSVASIQGTADQLAQQLRRLDTKIQEVNWAVTLLP